VDGGVECGELEAGIAAPALFAVGTAEFRAHADGEAEALGAVGTGGAYEHGVVALKRTDVQRPDDVAEVVEIVSQTCEALAATHDAGILHRDLKPENVFLIAGPSTFVKLLDYGVAKPMALEECIEADRVPAGTPQYMSPENMFEPEIAGIGSDLFSLAAVAYFALTRRTPFNADSIEGLYFAIDGGTFARPSELRPELPAALDRWFERALAHEAEDRFPSARAMVDALFDATREIHTARETLPAIELEPGPESSTHATVAELAVPMRRISGSSRRALAALVLATAASVLVWQTAGPEVPEANASVNSELDGGMDSGMKNVTAALENPESTE